VKSKKHRGFSAKLPGSAGFDRVDLSRLDLDLVDLDLTVAGVFRLSDGGGFDQRR
jgi:hypothetical protein